MIDLQIGETLLMLQRKHWFAIFLEGMVLLLIALLPLVIIIAVHFLLPLIYQIMGIPATVSIYVFFSSAWMLLMWVVFYVAFTNYYLDVLIITNKRIVDIEQIGLFSRDVASIPPENIQDVKIETTGMLATFMDYGDIHIQTAGSNKELLVRGIAEPSKVKAQILAVHQDAKNKALHHPTQQHPDTPTTTPDATTNQTPPTHVA